MTTRLELSKLSLLDALDLATLMEVEAHQRYVTFANQFGVTGGFDPGSFFLSMADNEAKHGQELSARRKELFGDTPRRVKLDDLFDVEAPELGSVRSSMSTLEAFQVALAAEEKARYFYEDALPTITDPDVRSLFAELRDEEIEHVHLLREAIAKLPAAASLGDEIDHDEGPYL